jgi:hypothetical protein
LPKASLSKASFDYARICLGDLPLETAGLLVEDF